MGEDMLWLLEEYWRERWIDRKTTFCTPRHTGRDVIEVKQTVEAFLQFAKVKGVQKNPNISVSVPSEFRKKQILKDCFFRNSDRIETEMLGFFGTPFTFAN